MKWYEWVGVLAACFIMHARSQHDSSSAGFHVPAVRLGARAEERVLIVGHRTTPDKHRSLDSGQRRAIFFPAFPLQR